VPLNLENSPQNIGRYADIFFTVYCFSQLQRGEIRNGRRAKTILRFIRIDGRQKSSLSDIGSSQLKRSCSWSLVAVFSRLGFVVKCDLDRCLLSRLYGLVLLHSQVACRILSVRRTLLRLRRRRRRFASPIQLYFLRIKRQ